MWKPVEQGRASSSCDVAPQIRTRGGGVVSVSCACVWHNFLESVVVLLFVVGGGADILFMAEFIMDKEQDTAFDGNIYFDVQNCSDCATLQTTRICVKRK
jgi:hypothetical protein